MPSVTIENVPEEVFSEIEERAKARDESVNDFLLELVNREFGTTTMW